MENKLGDIKLSAVSLLIALIIALVFVSAVDDGNVVFIPEGTVTESEDLDDSSNYIPEVSEDIIKEVIDTQIPAEDLSDNREDTFETGSETTGENMGHSDNSAEEDTIEDVQEELLPEEETDGDFQEELPLQENYEENLPESELNNTEEEIQIDIIAETDNSSLEGIFNPDLNISLYEESNITIDNGLNKSFEEDVLGFMNESFENSTVEDFLNITEEINLSLNITLELNITINQTLNITENLTQFNWSTNLILLYGSEQQSVAAIVELPSDLNEITSKIDEEEKKKSKNGISEGNGLGKLKKEIAEELDNKYPKTKLMIGKNIQSIEFTDLLVINDSIELGVEDLEIAEYIQSYAIDPSALEFSNATMTIIAKGTSLYKCKEWNFSEQKCYGEWKLYMGNLVPGESYSVKLSPEDPAFGEIVATSAVHLASDYSFISDIFDEVKAIDNVWSEPIYSGEIVRVIFEENLTDGRVIDVFARSNMTYAYFDIFEAGTNNSVGRSQIINNPEWTYITVNNLSKPIDTFDFKIVKVMPNLEDESTSINAEGVSFIEFDFIHDNAINSTQADGLIVYEEQNVATPRYRTWNKSNAFSSELSAQSVGVSGTADITWNILRANHERDEMILGTLDKTNDINIQIFNSGYVWSNLLEVSTDVPNSAYRAFDIAYEDISGDALIVYEDSSSADSTLKYRIWNGTGYSSVGTINTGLGADAIAWVSLFASPGTDRIMLLAHTESTADLAAIFWNGTGFDSSRSQVLTTSAFLNMYENFDFAWEENSGQGLAMYSSGNNIVYRTFSYTAPYWSTEATISIGDGAVGLRMCSDPTSDYIGYIWQDNANDVGVGMWDGSSMLSGNPAEDGTVEPSGQNNNNIDCSWHTSGSMALFIFSDSAGGSNGELFLDYFNFIKPNTWSTSDLTSTAITSSFATDDIDGVRINRHPTTNELMIVAQDTDEDVTLLRWTGSSFVAVAESPVETLTEVSNAFQESAMFSWYKNDPTPSVSGLLPVSGTYNIPDVIPINVTVTDNLNVSSVIINVTMPDGVTVLLSTSKNSNLYNSTFTNTTLGGTYTIRVIANDTSKHQNINNTVTSTFTVFESSIPSVFDVRPLAGNSYNISSSIEIATNATDSGGSINSVYANITYPNSTRTQLTLSNVLGAKYNNSFIIPNLLGQYNITFFANDSCGNINTTSTTFFVGLDAVKPLVFAYLPSENTNYNLSSSIQIATNVTDNVAVNNVYINITYPNSTRIQLTLGNAIGAKYNTSFTIASNLIGRYNLTYFANDTSNNLNSSVTSYFNVLDNIKPNASDARPIAGTNYNLSSIIEIAVNASDNIGVSTVIANITYPNSTRTQLILSNAVSAKYNTSFILPSGSIGVYNITFIINDISNNLNTSLRTNFAAHDNVIPLVFDVKPVASGSAAILTNIEISLNATDNIAVSRAYANLTYPNGTVQRISLSKTMGNKYNNSFSVPAVLGVYNLTYFANDTSGNINSTVQSNFTAVDNVPPRVIFVNPVADESFAQSSIVSIRVNVTDSINISAAYVNITLPNSSIVQLNLVDADSDNIYNDTFAITSALGAYTLTAYANDSSGNSNNTVMRTFYIQDSSIPFVELVYPSDDSAFNYRNITLNCNATDNSALQNISLYHNISGLFALNQTVNVSGTSNSSNFTLYNIPDGAYIWNCLVYDLSGNSVFHAVNHSFTLDATNPLMFDIVPSEASSYSTGDIIEIALNVTDNSAINLVYSNITYPNSTIEQIYLTNTIGNKYNNSFLINSYIVGNYSVAYFADDIYGNANMEFISFTVYDNIAPSVFSEIPFVGAAYNLSDTIEIAVNVTDNILVSSVTVNISYPNSSMHQISLLNTSAKYNNSFTIPKLLGQYNLTYIAIDSSGNSNNTLTTYFIAQDNSVPTLFSAFPSIGGSYSVSETFELAVNVTDNGIVDSVYVHITYPNSTVSTVLLSAAAGYKYNNSFSSRLHGDYSLLFFANDSLGNSNIILSNFSLVDNLSPVVYGVLPVSSFVYAASSLIEIATNVTESGFIDSVLANITYPNGTIEQIALANSVLDKYNTSFTTPVLDGSYSLRIIVNDTSGNINNTETSTFIIDASAPVINIVSPADYTNYSGSSVLFNFSVTDNIYSTLNCSLYIDSVLNITNNSVQNDSYTTFAVSGFIEGLHSWYIKCSDTLGNNNSTLARQLIIDSGKPSFISLETSPDTADLLDPNVNITVYANVTDNFTGIKEVILQRKLLNETEYTNLTLVGAGGNYTGTFNATQNGTYELRLWAIDNLNNSDTSNSINLSVQYDRSWNFVPSDLGVVAALFNSNISIGNLTINNTGDYALNFTITSDSINTTFNSSTIFELAPGAIKTIEAYDIANQSNKLITLTISAPDAEITSQAATARVIAALGQPILVVTITTPATENKTVSPGDTGIAFIANVQNIGEGNATNVTLFFTLPSEWPITYGSSSYFISDLNSGEQEELSIELSIPSNATAITEKVIANVTGYNSSSEGISDLIFSDSVDVIIQSTTVLGSLSSSSSSSDSGTYSLSSGGSGGGSSSKSTIDLIDRVLSDQLLLSTSEFVDLVRGDNITFEINISNIFADTKMYNVSLDLSGYFSKNIEIQNNFYSLIEYSETKAVKVTLIAPEYLSDGEYGLIARIYGKIYGEGFEKEFIETREITLRIHTITDAEAEALLSLAEQKITELENLGFKTAKIKLILEDAKKQLSTRDLAGFNERVQQIINMHSDAIAAKSQLESYSLKIEGMEMITGAFIEIPLEFSRTNELMELAQIAFEREDYAAALERLSEIDVALALENEQKGLFLFIFEYWWAILLIGGLLYSGALAVYPAYVRSRINIRMEKLDKEEAAVGNLIEQAQHEYFKKGIGSSSGMQLKMSQFLEDLSRIHTLRTKLRHKRVRILRPELIIKDLDAERKELLKNMEKLQKDYYVDSKITKILYETKIHIYHKRLAEIENEYITSEKLYLSKPRRLKTKRILKRSRR